MKDTTSIFVQPIPSGGVSKAVWPAAIQRTLCKQRMSWVRSLKRCVITCGERWWHFLLRFLHTQASPETPLPPSTPLVRVLETFDLSQTGVEHFLNGTDGYTAMAKKPFVREQYLPQIQYIHRPPQTPLSQPAMSRGR